MLMEIHYRLFEIAKGKVVVSATTNRFLYSASRFTVFVLPRFIDKKGIAPRVFMADLMVVALPIYHAIHYPLGASWAQGLEHH